MTALIALPSGPLAALIIVAAITLLAALTFATENRRNH